MMTTENFAMKLQAVLLELPDELRARGLDVAGVVLRPFPATPEDRAGVVADMSVHLADGTAFMVLVSELLGPRLRALK